MSKKGTGFNLSRRRFLAASSTAMGLAAFSETSVAIAQQTPTKPYGPWRIDADKVVRSCCNPNCAGACGINAFVKDNRILYVEPARFEDPRYDRICVKGIAYAMQKTYHPDRIKYPMKIASGSKRGEGKYVRISWEQAVDEISAKLLDIKKRHGTKSCAWMTMTGNLDLIANNCTARFADAFEGTNLTSAGIMADLAANMGFLQTTGSFPSHSQETNSLEEMQYSKLVICFGLNYAETEPNAFRFFLDAQDAGVRFVHIDPRFSTSASKSDLYIQIRPGTDAAMIYGMIQHIIASRKHNAEYLRKYTSGAYLIDDATKLYVRDKAGNFIVYDGKNPQPVKKEQGAEVPGGALLSTGSITVSVDGKQIKCCTAYDKFVEHINANYTPAKASAICEVPESVIKDLAIEYATTDPAIIRMTQGIQRYYSGHLSYRAALVLGAICGNIGKRYAGVSWASGALFRMIFGMPPEWLYPVKWQDPDTAKMSSWAEASSTEEKGARNVNGTEILNILETGKPYPLKAVWFAGYGFGTQVPRRKKLLELMQKLELVVVSENIMSPGAKHADYILPVTTFYEMESDISCMVLSYHVQRHSQAVTPLYEAKDDIEIYSMFARKMNLPGNWSMTATQHVDFLLNAYKTTKGPFKFDCFVNMDIAELNRDGYTLAGMPKSFVPFEDQKFDTNTGKFEMYSEMMVPYDEAIPTYKEPLESKKNKLASKYPLVFMNVHSKYTAHSQHRVLPWIKELDPEPLLEVNPADASARGLKDGDKVDVFNDRGRFTVKIMLSEGIKAGVVNMPEGWWPDHFDNKSHYADLLHMTLNPAQNAMLDTNYAPYDNLVQIARAK